MVRQLMRRSLATGDICRRWMTAGAGGSSKTTVLSFGDGSIGSLGLPFSYSVSIEALQGQDTWSLSARVEGLVDVEVKAAFASGVAFHGRWR